MGVGGRGGDNERRGGDGEEEGGRGSEGRDRAKVGHGAWRGDRAEEGKRGGGKGSGRGGGDGLRGRLTGAFIVLFRGKNRWTESMHTARNRWTPGQAIESTPPGLAGIEVFINLRHWPEWGKTAAHASIFCRIYIGCQASRTRVD